MAEKTAEKSFLVVFECGPKIELDHYLVYHARGSPIDIDTTLPITLPDYELGRLYASQGDIDAARHQFELVLSSKVNVSGRKSKYSMEVCRFSKSCLRDS